MLGNRFREFWGQSEDLLPGPAVAVAAPSAAFVQCPCPVFQAMSPVQQSQVEYLYRLAYEQAQAQVARRRTRWAEFSRN